MRAVHLFPQVRADAVANWSGVIARMGGLIMLFNSVFGGVGNGAEADIHSGSSGECSTLPTAHADRCFSDEEHRKPWRGPEVAPMNHGRLAPAHAASRLIIE